MVQLSSSLNCNTCAADALSYRACAEHSPGVLWPSRLRGRVFSFRAMAAESAGGGGRLARTVAFPSPPVILSV
jgi:hypothetical protein